MIVIGVKCLPQWWGVLRIVAPNDAAVGCRLGRCGMLFLRMRAIVKVLLINQCGLVRRNVWKSSLFFGCSESSSGVQRVPSCSEQMGLRVRRKGSQVINVILFKSQR